MISPSFATLRFHHNAGMNSPEPAQPRAANQPHQDGFSLVVERVSGGDPVHNVFVNVALEGRSFNSARFLVGEGVSFSPTVEGSTVEGSTVEERRFSAV
jgi:hypothetical protein